MLFSLFYQSKGKKSRFNDRYCCVTTKNISIKDPIDLSLKFVNFHTLKIFEPQNIVRIEKKIGKKLLICSPQKFCSKNFSDFFLYNEDKSISFTKQEKKVYHRAIFFRIELKPSERMDG